MNPLLAKIQDEITAKVKPEAKADFFNAIKAGRLILYSPDTHKNLQMVQNPDKVKQDPVGTFSTGIASLGKLMYTQSGNQADPEALIPALIFLMCDAMDFAEKSLGLTIDNTIVAQATKALVAKIFQALGVKPEHMQQLIEQNQGKMQQPPGQDPAQQAPAPQPGLLQGGAL